MQQAEQLPVKSQLNVVTQYQLWTAIC